MIRLHGLAIGLTLGALGGCATLMPGVANLSAQQAENPLKGQPLHWSRPAQGLPFDGEKACSTWPVEDQLTIKASESELCVDGKVYKLAPAEFSEDRETSLAIDSDGSTGGGIAGGHAEGPKARPQKIGSCFDKNTNKEKSIWVSSYAGCVPNKGATGAPLLTSTSSYLQVGDARWKFPASSGSPAPSQPAASQAGSGSPGS